jgi:transposase
VRLRLRTRRHFCTNELCRQRVFCERLPNVVAAYGRRTVRLNDALTLIGFALGGEAGARTANSLGLIASGDTLLRRIRQFAVREADVVTSPRIVGVDDWARRKGHSYGTLLVDLEGHRPLDLLPDRDAETLAEWLRAHPGVEIVTRDRAPAYAEGIRSGAPQAVQIADRWHLLKNMGETVEQWSDHHQSLIPEVAMRGSGTEEAAYDPRLFRPVANYVAWCWRRGERDVQRLWRDITGSGVRVSRKDFNVFIDQLQAGLETPLPRLRRRVNPQARRLSPVEVAKLLMLRPDHLSPEEYQFLDEWKRDCPEAREAYNLTQAFIRMVSERQPDNFDQWIRRARRSGPEEFISFGAGLLRDESAVRAAMKYEWSNGQVEGQITRLKLLKRQMYGRAKLDLLRARVLHSV